MVSLTYFPQKHEFKVFIFLLDETGMAQNNSLFVWKTSNYSRGRSNLRNGMSQTTNLQSLVFTQQRIANLLGVLPEFILWDIDFGAFSLFIILENTLATGCLCCLNELTAWQVCVTSVSEPIYIESGKTLSDEESPRYEVSENNSRFDESTTHKSTLLILISVSFLNQCCFFP